MEDRETIVIKENPRKHCEAIIIDPRAETEAAPDDPIDLWYPIHEYQSGLSPYKSFSIFSSIYDLQGDLLKIK